MDGEFGIEIGAGQGEHEFHLSLSLLDKAFDVDAGLLFDFPDDGLVGALSRIDESADEVERSFLRLLRPNAYEQFTLLVGDDGGTGGRCVKVEHESAVVTSF